MSKRLGQVLSIEEACDYLKIPRSTLYKLAQERKIPCQKVGRHWRFLKDAIDRWLEASYGRDEGQRAGMIGEKH